MAGDISEPSTVPQTYDVFVLGGGSVSGTGLRLGTRC